MISRSALSLLLLVAGVIHLARPDLFNPAIPFDHKFEINLAAGILEILLAIGFWIPKSRELSARLSALWFLLLIPIHVYVSFYQIPIFGVSDPSLLWGRTFLQPLLFFWALSLQRKGWIISQRWSEVLFLHYEVDSTELQKIVPYPIDLFGGKAVVSIVPFVMSSIRFPFLPAIPGLSKLMELNLRTYVRVNGRPAVYFFTLDSNHWPGVLIARLGFSLPYRYRVMRLDHEKSYLFKSKELILEAQVQEEIRNSDFDRWTTERYALVTRRLGKDLLGVVEHEPWQLKSAQIIHLEDHFSGQFIKLKSFLGASYAETLDVRFRPFTTFSTSSRRDHD
jgi:uncharacterized protein